MIACLNQSIWLLVQLDQTQTLSTCMILLVVIQKRHVQTKVLYRPDIPESYLFCVCNDL